MPLSPACIQLPKSERSIEPLVAAGKVRINIEQTYPLERIAEAQQHNIAGHTRGKVVVDMGVVPAGAHE